MENFRRSVLGISARWSSRYCLSLLFAILTSLSLPAQEELDSNTKFDLSDKEQHRFNELFFMAEKEKNLGNIEEALKIYEQLYEINPDNATVCYEMARIYAEGEDAENAVFYAERAVELDPENKWFKILLASVYREFNRPQKEIAIFRDLAEQFPDNPDYRYELAIAYHNAEEYKKAIEEFDKLEELIGINEVITDHKKTIYLEMGNVDGAAEEIEQLIKAYPRELDYYGILGQMYQINGFDKKAFDTYQEMLRIAPDDPRPHLDLAEYYRQQNNMEQSLFHLKKAMASPELEIDKKIPVLLSLFSASEKDSSLLSEAFIMLEGLIETNPGDPRAYAIYGDFLSREGRNAEALNAYKKAVSLDEGNKFEIWEQILLIEIQTEMYDSLLTDGPEAIDLFPNQPLPYFFTGVAFNMTGNPEEGIYHLEEGLNYVIGNPRLKEQFYIQLADAHHRLKKHMESDGYFEKALALNPNNSLTLNNYAYYLSVRGEKLDKALEMTRKSNALSPGNPTYIDTWAWVLFKNGQYSEALEKMEKVIEMGGAETGEVLEHYGDILLKNNRKDEALEQYKKAKKAGGTTDQIDRKINGLIAP